MSTIYEVIEKDPAGALPDQNELVLREGEVWVPGAYEGTLMRSDFSIKQHVVTNYIAARRVRKFALAPTLDNQKAVENCISKYSAISLADPVLSFLEHMHTDKQKLLEAAFILATQSGRREAVKLAIVLLGFCGQGNARAAHIVETLSRHDEFAAYGVVALKNILPKEEADTVLTELGEELSGWGKIALMYELDYSLPAVRSWTLQKGCRNSIGLSYLANVCAIKGRLKDYLLEREMEFEPIEPEYFPGICDIFRGLLEENSENDGIYEYPDAVAAADCLRTTLKMSPPEMQEAAKDIVALLDKKNIGDPKAADSVISF